MLDQSAERIVETAKRTGAFVSGPVPLPTEINRFCVQRSTNNDKKSREHFEMRTHKRLIDILQASPKTMDALMHLDLAGRRRHRTQSLTQALPDRSGLL